MNTEQRETIKAIAKELFSMISLEGNIQTEEKEEGGLAISVTCEDPQLYIGEKGQTLSEILYILKSLARRKLGESVYIALDINDYWKNKEHYTRELARTTADEVSLFKAPKELSPMSAVERRIVHMELQERNDVETESAGDGETRRVIIRLATREGKEER